MLYKKRMKMANKTLCIVQSEMNFWIKAVLENFLISSKEKLSNYKFISWRQLWSFHIQACTPLYVVSIVVILTQNYILGSTVGNWTDLWEPIHNVPLVLGAFLKISQGTPSVQDAMLLMVWKNKWDKHM